MNKRTLFVCLCLLALGCGVVYAVVTQVNTTLTVSYKGSDGSLHSVTSAPLAMAVTTDPDLEVTLTADKTSVAKGGVVKFTATVKNVGSETASAIVLKPDVVHFTAPASLTVADLAAGATTSVSWDATAK